MKKARIIKRTYPDGETRFIIQQRHFLFKWWWVDAWINNGVECEDNFSTLEEAKNALHRFDGSETKEEVILEV